MVIDDDCYVKYGSLPDIVERIEELYRENNFNSEVYNKFISAIEKKIMSADVKETIEFLSKIALLYGDVSVMLYEFIAKILSVLRNKEIDDELLLTLWDSVPVFLKAPIFIILGKKFRKLALLDDVIRYVRTIHRFSIDNLYFATWLALMRKRVLLDAVYYGLRTRNLEFLLDIFRNVRFLKMPFIDELAIIFLAGLDRYGRLDWVELRDILAEIGFLDEEYADILPEKLKEQLLGIAEKLDFGKFILNFLRYVSWGSERFARGLVSVLRDILRKKFWSITLGEFGGIIHELCDAHELIPTAENESLAMELIRCVLDDLVFRIENSPLAEVFNFLDSLYFLYERTESDRVLVGALNLIHPEKWFPRKIFEADPKVVRKVFDIFSRDERVLYDVLRSFSKDQLHSIMDMLSYRVIHYIWLVSTINKEFAEELFDEFTGIYLKKIKDFDIESVAEDIRYITDLLGINYAKKFIDRLSNALKDLIASLEADELISALYNLSRRYDFESRKEVMIFFWRKFQKEISEKLEQASFLDILELRFIPLEKSLKITASRILKNKVDVAYFYGRSFKAVIRDLMGVAYINSRIAKRLLLLIGDYLVKKLEEEDAKKVLDITFYLGPVDETFLKALFDMINPTIVKKITKFSLKDLILFIGGLSSYCETCAIDLLDYIKSVLYDKIVKISSMHSLALLIRDIKSWEGRNKLKKALIEIFDRGLSTIIEEEKLIERIRNMNLADTIKVLAEIFESETNTAYFVLNKTIDMIKEKFKKANLFELYVFFKSLSSLPLGIARYIMSLLRDEIRMRVSNLPPSKIIAILEAMRDNRRVFRIFVEAIKAELREKLRDASIEELVIFLFGTFIEPNEMKYVLEAMSNAIDWNKHISNLDLLSIGKLLRELRNIDENFARKVLRRALGVIKKKIAESNLLDVVIFIRQVSMLKIRDKLLKILKAINVSKIKNTDTDIVAEFISSVGEIDKSKAKIWLRDILSKNLSGEILSRASILEITNFLHSLYRFDSEIAVDILNKNADIIKQKLLEAIHPIERQYFKKKLSELLTNVSLVGRFLGCL